MIVDIEYEKYERLKNNVLNNRVGTVKDREYFFKYVFRDSGSTKTTGAYERRGLPSVSSPTPRPLIRFPS
jgi:hypothetical protein